MISNIATHSHDHEPQLAAQGKKKNNENSTKMNTQQHDLEISISFHFKSTVFLWWSFMKAPTQHLHNLHWRRNYFFYYCEPACSQTRDLHSLKSSWHLWWVCCEHRGELLLPFCSLTNSQEAPVVKNKQGAPHVFIIIFTGGKLTKTKPNPQIYKLNIVTWFWYQVIHKMMIHHCST